MFIILSKKKKENFLKSIMVASMLTGALYLDTNVLNQVTYGNKQNIVVRAGIGHWERDTNADHAHVGGSVAYVERYKILGITFKKRIVHVPVQ